MGRTSYRRKNLAGLALRQHRERLGLSQDDLARKCQLLGWDVDRLTITRIEGGNRLLCDYELLIFAEVLAVPPVELFPAKPDLRPYLASA
jgi:transcriptional regulator with XRE-family HTH domain